MPLIPVENPDELLYIRTPFVSVTVKGSASHPSLPGITFDQKESSLRVSCENVFDLALPGDTKTISEKPMGNVYLGEYLLCPLFFEQQRYEIVIEPLEGHTAVLWHDNYNIRKSVTPVGRNSSILSGIINFGSEIGLSDFAILIDGNPYLHFTSEVFPSKISYKEDYRAIVADVTAELYGLVFDFLKKTYDTFDVGSTRQSSPVEFFTIIRKIYARFVAAVDIILSKPHHQLETECPVLPSHKVKRTDNRTIRWIEKHPDQATRGKGGILVSRAMAVRKHVTYDTKENRLTKYMLLSTVRRLEQFGNLYELLLRDTDPAVLSVLNEMINGVRRRASTGFLREVESVPSDSGMSLVFGMAPGYRDLYRDYLLMQHGLSVTGNIFHLSVKDLADLYEYWCFIKLNGLLRTRYQLVSQNIIQTYGKGLFVSLVKGDSSEVTYENPDTGEQITLTYNPQEKTLPTVNQRPDNVLSLKKKGSRIDYDYVFDAKYRINSAPVGSRYHQLYGKPGPQEDDINTMHRYRDAIVYRQQAEPYERTMFGAYVLFPYHNESEYSNHHFYKSIEKVNIGGLPFLPSATNLVTSLLDELISDSPASAFERATLPNGVEEHLQTVDWKKRDVLIGFVRDAAQLTRCLKSKTYYTYRQNIAKKHLPLHYVALYQPSVGICYYGKVLTTQQLKRRDLPGNGRNPYDSCYLFEVEEWLSLPQIIRPEEYAPNPIAYTNLFLLQHCDTYPELHLHDEAEFRLIVVE